MWQRMQGSLFVSVSPGENLGMSGERLGHRPSARLIEHVPGHMEMQEKPQDIALSNMDTIFCA